jgi:hypothetical protein
MRPRLAAPLTCRSLEAANALLGGVQRLRVITHAGGPKYREAASRRRALRGRCCVFRCPDRPHKTHPHNMGGAGECMLNNSDAHWYKDHSATFEMAASGGRWDRPELHPLLRQIVSIAIGARRCEAESVRVEFARSPRAGRH